MFKNTYKILLYFCLISIPLTTKPALADKNFIREMGTQVTSNINNISVVSGKLSYRQRIALPVNSQIIIKLLDLSLPDSPLAQQIILTKGENVPILFQLKFNKLDIIPNHSYTVRAEIRIEDRLAFTTTRNYPVITNGAPETIDILLDPVGTLGLEQQLQQGQWLLEDLGGRGVIDNLQTTLKFDSQGRISGLAGCNRYFGQYQLKGKNIKFSNIASTRKACSGAVANQEYLFLSALEKAYQLQIDGPYLLIYSKELKQPLKFTLLY